MILGLEELLSGKSPTEEPMVWNKPKKAGCSPKPAALLNFRPSLTCQPHHTYFNPGMKNNDQQELEEMFMQMVLERGSNCIGLTSFDRDDAVESNTVLPRNLIEICNLYKLSTKTYSFDNFVDFLKSNLTLDDICVISEKTSGQSDNEFWIKQRTGRLTASLFGQVMHCKHIHKDCSIVKSINNLYAPFKSNATEYGKNAEILARDWYVKKHKENHRGSKVSETGLTISEALPYLGASVDGLVNCKICGQGLIEIKSPYTFKDRPAEDYIKEANSVHFEYIGNKISLKKESKWHYQIQGQLAICDRKWCDLVVYTTVGNPYVLRIEFDQDLWKIMLEKLVFFYKNAVYPFLMDL